MVVEWVTELFDEPTARWCFDRLGEEGDGDEPSWLHRHRESWWDSGKPWEEYFGEWVLDHGLHTGRAIQQALDARFRARLVSREPYFFPALDGATDADERAAIDAGAIRATGLRYVGRRPAGVR